MAIASISRIHWQAYLQAECTKEKMIRNLSIDLLGLLLTMGAAMSMGRVAGGYFGMQAGLWAGLASAPLSAGLAGFISGFLAAWAVRSVWGRLVPSV